MIVRRRKRSKENNELTSYDGYLFGSKGEAYRYTELKILEKAGEIKNLKVHPRYMLHPAFDSWGEHIRPTYYIPDFEYFEKASGRTIVEDFKGHAVQDDPQFDFAVHDAERRLRIAHHQLLVLEIARDSLPIDLQAQLVFAFGV